MLPIERAEITYSDGSKYRIPEDGTWAEAPPFGVQAIVYYHVPDPGGLQRTTSDDGRDVYVCQEPGYPDDVKMGLWLDADGFYRVQDLARRRTLPEV